MFPDGVSRNARNGLSLPLTTEGTRIIAHEKRLIRALSCRVAGMPNCRPRVL
jgi:hypothetical protein